MMLSQSHIADTLENIQLTGAGQIMRGKTDLSDEELKDLRVRLEGTPLESRNKWILKQAAFVLVCVVGLVIVLKLADGIWLAVGLTVLAFLAGMLPELFIDLRYSKYRREWEMVNGSLS